jgi:hypothetical protein
MKNRLTSEFIPTIVVCVHALIAQNLIDDKTETKFQVLLAMPFVLFYVFWFKNEKSFPAMSIGVASGLAYGFLNYLYLLGIQLPGKGEGTLLSVTLTLAFSYVALTCSMACIVLYMANLAKRE